MFKPKDDTPTLSQRPPHLYLDTYPMQVVSLPSHIPFEEATEKDFEPGFIIGYESCKDTFAFVRYFYPQHLADTPDLQLRTKGSGNNTPYGTLYRHNYADPKLIEFWVRLLVAQIKAMRNGFDIYDGRVMSMEQFARYYEGLDGDDADKTYIYDFDDTEPLNDWFSLVVEMMGWTFEYTGDSDIHLLHWKRKAHQRPSFKLPDHSSIHFGKIVMTDEGQDD